MSERQLPDPLVPAEVDLRGLEYMPLLGHHLFGSDFNAQCSDSEWRTGLTLWWAAWNQVPAASLPNDDSSLTRLADMGRDVKGFRKIKAKALHGFVLCSDGRLYHKFLAPQALVAWEKRVESTNKAKAEAERKRKERARRARMFEQLHEVGVAPEWNTTTAELERLVAQHVTHLSRGQAPPVTPDNSHLSRGQGGDVTPPVTPPVTAKTGRDVTGRDGTLTSTPSHRSSGVPTGSPAHQDADDATPDDSKPNGEHQAATMRGAMSAALRTEGVQVTPGHPLLVAWIAQGVTIQEAREAVDRARHHKPAPQPISPKYLDPIIADVVAERGKNGHSHSAVKAKPWYLTASGIEAKGAELGVAQGDDFQAFRREVYRRAGVTMGQVEREERDWAA